METITTLEEDLRMVYYQMGWRTVQPHEGKFYLLDPDGYRTTSCVTTDEAWAQLPDPTEDTHEGLAEFARLLLWATALEQGFVATIAVGWCSFYDTKTGHDTGAYVGKQQEALIRALAVAIRDRETGREEEA